MWLNDCLLFNVPVNPSIASSRPMPLVAEVLNSCHFPSFRTGNPSKLAISERVMTCSVSYLLANITKMDFLNSPSSSMATNYYLGMPVQSPSQLPTQKWLHLCNINMCNNNIPSMAWYFSVLLNPGIGIQSSCMLPSQL